MSVAKSYAKALYEAAVDSSVSAEGLNQLEQQLDTLTGLFESSRELKVALLAPLTTMREKSELIANLSKSLQWSPLLSQFLVLLIKKKRLNLLSSIREAFNEVRLGQEGGISGRLVAAEAMSEADINSLVKAFSQKLGKKVAFRVSTDPSLLAGMKVTVNGVTYDGSLRSQLQKLRDRFVAGMPGFNA